MHSSHVLYAVLLSTFITANTDWLFAGDIWMRFYRIHPASWRSKAEGFREGPAIAGSILLTLVTCAIFTGILQCAHMHGYRCSMIFALMVWLAAPLPLLFTQSFFMKYPWQLAALHSIGWLVKLEIVAISSALFHL
jgi:hypothetical protein